MVVITCHDYDSSISYVYGTCDNFEQAEQILREQETPHPRMSYYRATEWEGMKRLTPTICYHFREDWQETLSRYNRSTDSYQNKYIG